MALKVRTKALFWKWSERPKKGSKLRSDACMTASDGLELAWQGITIKVTPTDAYRVSRQF